MRFREKIFCWDGNNIALHCSETKIKQRAKAFSSMASLPNLEPSKNLKNQNDA